MALESGDFITALNELNPTAGDPVAQGDDHLRLLKHVLLNSFPGLNQSLFTFLSGNYSPAGHTHAYLPLTGGSLTGPLNIVVGQTAEAALVLGSANLDLLRLIRQTDGVIGIQHFNGTGGFDKWLIRGNVDANRVITSVGFDAPIACGAITSNDVIRSARLISTYNSQTAYGSAAVTSEATTGDVHYGFHAVGSSAVSIKHVRGGSGVAVMDSVGTALAPISASNVLGVAQTVQDVTGSRALNATYTNTVGKPITVMVICTLQPGGSMETHINSIVAGSVTAGAPVAALYTTSFVVGPGVAYGLAVSNGTLNRWTEYR
jgi:hypothetical protein